MFFSNLRSRKFPLKKGVAEAWLAELQKILILKGLKSLQVYSNKCTQLRGACAE